MDTPYAALRDQLAKTPKKWLVTGVAGFIGSKLLGYAPPHWLADGVAEAMPRYMRQSS